MALHMIQTAEPNLPPSSARLLFASELRRMRQASGLSQEQLAALILHSRTLIASVELGERWPPRDLAERCDGALRSGGMLVRLWPLVDSERLNARRVVADARLSDLHEVVLRLAALIGTDVSVLSVAGSDAESEMRGGKILDVSQQDSP